jgi:hypothetical protein
VRLLLATLAAVALVSSAAAFAAAGGGRDRAGVRPEAVPIRPGGPAAQAAGRRALRLVSYPWRTLGYRIVFAPARPGLRGETIRATHTIAIFVRPSDVPHRIAHDIAHELGHAYDDRHMTPALRRAYLGRRGVPRARWWPWQATDYGAGAGDFAEVFALCHAASPEFRSTLAPLPADACGALPPGARSTMAAAG